MRNNKNEFLTAFILMLASGFADLLGLKKSNDKPNNAFKKLDNTASKSAEPVLTEPKILKNRVVFWHNPTTEYRTGIIIREFENGSVEILQDAPYGGLIRKTKKTLVMDGRAGKVTIY